MGDDVWGYELRASGNHQIRLSMSLWTLLVMLQIRSKDSKILSRFCLQLSHVQLSC